MPRAIHQGANVARVLMHEFLLNEGADFRIVIGLAETYGLLVDVVGTGREFLLQIYRGGQRVVLGDGRLLLLVHLGSNI
ncbi:hypothetical protein M8J76_012923 [Diaphorina citri]|nr:hypothetical protein M8J76_012923 [Diaphorina citri]